MRKTLLAAAATFVALASFATAPFHASGEC